MSVSFNIKPIDTDEFKIQLAIPPENPTMRGFVTVGAKVRSKNELKEFGEKIQANEFEDDIAILQAMYPGGVKGLGSDAGPVEGDKVWEFLQTSPVGGFIVPALIEAYFDQYQGARQKNSARLRSR